MYLKWSVFKFGLRLELLRVNQCDIPASVSQVLHEPLIISQSCLPSRKQTRHVGSKKTPVWNHPSNWSDDVCLLKTVDRYRLCVPEIVNPPPPKKTNYPTFTDLSLTDLGHCSILRTPLPPPSSFWLASKFASLNVYITDSGANIHHYPTSVYLLQREKLQLNFINTVVIIFA